MITHYLKIGFRNLLKYRQQTVISVVGLAVGFVCFALSSLWIWYENSFDTFHPGAERIYFVQVKSLIYKYTDYVTPAGLAAYLENKFPEIEAACRVQYRSEKIIKFESDEPGIKLDGFQVDSSFLRVFDATVLDRNTHIPFGQDGTVAITDRALSRFSKKYRNSNLKQCYIEDYNGGVTLTPISAVVQAWPLHTNFKFDVLTPTSVFNDNDLWAFSSLYTFIRLKEGVDIAQFEKKLAAIRIPETHLENSQLSLIPLKDFYYQVSFFRNRQIQYDYIPLFSLAGLLVICSALFNFLALFISRLRLKGNELVLRKVNGALNRQLLLQIVTEMAIVLFLVLFFSCLILEWIYPLFESIAQIQLAKADVITLLILGFIGLMFLTLLISVIPVIYFKTQTLQQTLRSTNSGHNRHLFSRFSLLIQCMVGIFFLFCMATMACQIHYAKKVDIGFDRKDLVSINYFYRSWPEEEAILFLSELKKEPSIKSAVLSTDIFFPIGTGEGRSGFRAKNRSGEDIIVDVYYVFPDVLELLDLKIIEGSMPRKGESAILLNEKAQDLLDESYFIGAQKELSIGKSTFNAPIGGVVKNFEWLPPKMAIQPTILIYDPNNKECTRVYIKYHPGMRAEADQAIRTILNEKIKIYPPICYTDDEYEKYFKEDNIILGLLSVLAFVCILITFFGIYAMISLVCEQRRKEIAIRKINGASTATLLMLFVKEYLFVLLGAALIVFPVGYLAMQSWIEQYNNRIHIIPIYLLVVAVTLLLVGITVIAWVWKSVHTNPAQELKKE